MDPHTVHLYPAEGQTEEERLEELFTTFLVRAKNYVDQYLYRDFGEELENGEIAEIPPGIEDASLRLAANMVLRMAHAQNQFIVTREDGTQAYQSTRVFTRDIKDDLDLFNEGGNRPRFYRNRTLTELENADTSN